ncbi:efflux pump antibiotic resistance protein [Dissoconium aciculare CBS 342.82]|uniref:Efflux pump antibiotic resistance protein n=1 Tax=Dissoconium aciculare CBS 342.82 TaxID=1314786 RepID=A0A6J3LQI0_9PEZI|nr:efflux pump antibiotic resistance protein [Dissoconium aciculare CBS 342.82]KAF1817893.1 efflux pump antibiotic resistance protein [Dissoconium aciculare CBS 342.82]
MLSVYAVTILTAIDMNIVATAVPVLTDYFHTVVNVGWYATAFRLCYCAFQFLFGKAYTLFPIKPVFVLSNVIWILGVTLCGAAASPNILIAGRAIAGLGTAGLMAGNALIIVRSIPLHKRPLFQGLQAGIEGVSVLAGPLLGGVITQYVDWRWCFYINLPFGGACLIFIVYCFTDATPRKVSGGLLQKLVALFLALAWAGTEYAWNSTTIIGLFVAFAALFVVFVVNQHKRGDAAVLPLRLFRRRSVVATLSFACLLNSAGNVLDYYLPTYFQSAHEYSPAQSGYLMIPIIIGGTLGAIGQGVGTSITGQYGPFMLGASVSMCTACGLITTFSHDTSLAKLILYTAWSGLSYGSGICVNPIALQAILPDQDIPIAMSTLLFMDSVGPAIAIAIAQVIFTNGLSINLAGVSGFENVSIGESGLTQFVKNAQVSQKEAVLDAVAQSMSPLWYLVLSLACTTIFGAYLTEWRSLKKEDPETT